MTTKSTSRFVYDHATEFKLREKFWSLSGDSFSIKNLSNNASTFKVKGNAFSLKDSKQLCDSRNKPILKMTESLFTLRGRMHITDASTKRTVLTLRKKGFIPMTGTGTILAWKGGDDDGKPDIVCKGDFFRKDFVIKNKSGKVLATIRRKSFNLSNILLEKDSYVVRIEPGVDAALMIFMVVAVDEQYRDDGERRGYSSFL